MKTSKNTERLLLLILVGIGVLFIAIGAVVYGHYAKTTAGYIDVEGVISDFGYNKAPIITYEWEGETYTVKGQTKSSFQRVGSTYSLKIDPLSPALVADPATFILSIVFMVVGGVLIAVGLLVVGLLRRGRQKRLDLIAYGTRVTATVTQVERNRSVTVNGRHPYRVYAECRHPVTGLTEELSSHNVWSVSLRPGDRVDIVFDPINEKKFAFDLREDAQA